MSAGEFICNWVRTSPHRHWSLFMWGLCRCHAELRLSKPQNFQRFSRVAPTPLSSCLNILGRRTMSRSSSPADTWRRRNARVAAITVSSSFLDFNTSQSLSHVVNALFVSRLSPTASTTGTCSCSSLMLH